MTILEQLQKWSEKTGGKAETVSTITLSTEQMNLIVHGVSLEDAYEKIKEVCSDFKTEIKEEETKEEVKQPTEPVIPSSIPSFTNPMPNLSNIDLNHASTKTLAETLGSRKIIKIYTPGTPLENGEEVITYQNTKYVVK